MAQSTILPEVVATPVPEPRRRKRGRAIGHRPSEEGVRLIDALRKTRLVLSVGTALGDHLLMIAVIIAALLLDGYRRPLLALLTPLLWLVAARAQRGLEVLVHEGSHYNFTRRHALNDRIVDLVAAYPVFSMTTQFRRPHRRHHLGFGGDDDPCHFRFELFGWERVKREPMAFLRHTFRRITPYAWGWWAQVGTDRHTLRSALLWHALVLIVPLTLAFGAEGVVWWLLYWFLPFVLVLPFVRFVGESEKHEYLGTSTVFDGTISSVGKMHTLLWHPHGDGYHLLHHLDPSIPHHALAKAHRTLLWIDPEYREGHRHRKRVFEAARKGESVSLEELYPELLDRDGAARVEDE